MSSKLHGHFFQRVLTCANNTVPRCAKYLTWDFLCLWTKVLKDYDLQRGESTWELNTWDWNALCSNGQGLAEGSICVIKYEWKMVWCKAIHTRYIFGWSSFHVLIPSLLQAIYTRFYFVSLDQEYFCCFDLKPTPLYERGNKTKYQTYYNHKMMLSSRWKTSHFQLPPCTGRSWFWFCSETRNLMWTFFHSPGKSGVCNFEMSRNRFLRKEFQRQMCWSGQR
jgi:hypothetical protein